MKRWRRPLVFLLTYVGRRQVGGDWIDELRWQVSFSTGVDVIVLGEARRVPYRGPRRGTAWRWEPWPAGAQEPLKPSASSLDEAGRILARHVGRM